MDALSDDTSIFSKELRDKIGESVLDRLSGDAEIATLETRSYAKGQVNEYIYNYFPKKLWTVILSQETMK